MIDKFIKELNSEIEKNNIEDNSVVDNYIALHDKYIALGQSEFDIICHFGEPSEIVANYMKTGSWNMPDMEERKVSDMPAYLEVCEDIAPKKEVKKEENTAPTTKAGLILNDIFFVGLGLVFALAGVIALGTVSILMTATSVYQLVEVWNMATTGQRWGGFALALMALIACAFFFYVIVWIVKVVVKYMKKYIPEHRENWAKCNNTNE